MSATLASLRIRNLALVEDLLWELRPGFTAITGETGAGKSIIVGAFKLLIGDRADKTLVRSGSDTCTVEAVLEIPKNSAIHALLDESGAEACENGQLLIRRTVPNAGTGKQFVNGSPATISLLKQMGDLLVDLHGPHDHQSLFSREQQTHLLDAFAGSAELQAEFTIRRKNLFALISEQDEIRQHEATRVREIELLDHEVKEIQSAELTAGEEEPLVARQKAAAHSKRLGEIAFSLQALLTDSEDAIHSRLSEAARLLKEMVRLDPATSSLLSQHDALSESVQTFSRTIQDYAENLSLEPAHLAEVEARLDVIQSLKRKYGSTVEEVLASCAVASTKLELLRSQETRRDNLDSEIESARKKLATLGESLSAKRNAGAPRLAELTRKHLADLGFKRAGFSITLEPLAEPGPAGNETAEFVFAPNPGEPELPLRAIASSGEISRVMLALKTALAVQDSIPILVFDEIDANVGGEIGAKVGAKMQELAVTHQVICITHLPQVAAQASTHFAVNKAVHAGRTLTTLSEITNSAREEEIARMLGGANQSALRHAKTLLGVES